MLDWRLASAHVILAVTLMLWGSREVLSVDVATEALDAGIRDVQSPPTVREEKSAADLAAKLMLLDELVSLENDVIETKKKRSFSGFGSPLDRLSAGSMDHKVFPAKATIYMPQTKARKHRNFSVMQRGYLPRLKAGREKTESGSGELIEDAQRKYTRSMDSDFIDFVLSGLLCFNRKVVDHPKRRFGIPIDRIGGNRLSNSRG